MSAADPVHYAAEPPANDMVHYAGPGWYFWDETWGDRHGPYDSEEAARSGCLTYARTL